MHGSKGGHPRDKSRDYGGYEGRGGQDYGRGGGRGRGGGQGGGHGGGGGGGGGQYNSRAEVSRVPAGGAVNLLSNHFKMTIS